MCCEDSFDILSDGNLKSKTFSTVGGNQATNKLPSPTIARIQGLMLRTLSWDSNRAPLWDSFASSFLKRALKALVCVRESDVSFHPPHNSNCPGNKRNSPACWTLFIKRKKKINLWNVAAIRGFIELYCYLLAEKNNFSTKITVLQGLMGTQLYLHQFLFNSSISSTTFSRSDHKIFAWVSLAIGKHYLQRQHSPLLDNHNY